MRILQEKKRSEFCTRIVAENDTRNVASGTNNYRVRDQNNTKEGEKMSNIYSNHLIVRMTDKEKSMLQEAANRKGVTMSKYVRGFLSEKLRDIYFGDNASDNAVGTAILGMRYLKE